MREGSQLSWRAFLAATATHVHLIPENLKQMFCCHPEGTTYKHRRLTSKHLYQHCFDSFLDDLSWPHSLLFMLIIFPGVQACFKHSVNFFTLRMSTVSIEEDMDLVLDFNPTAASNPLQPLLLDLSPDHRNTLPASCCRINIWQKCWIDLPG